MLVIIANGETSEFRIASVPPAVTSGVNNNSSSPQLTLVLMTPTRGKLGFGRNAAASTLALRQAQLDGFLSKFNIT